MDNILTSVFVCILYLCGILFEAILNLVMVVAAAFQFIWLCICPCDCCFSVHLFVSLCLWAAFLTLCFSTCGSCF